MAKKMTLPKTVEIIRASFEETLERVARAGGCDLVLTSPPYMDCLMVLDGPVRK